MNGHTQNFTSSLRQTFLGFKALKNIRLSDFRKVFSLMGKTEKKAFGLLTAVALASLIISGRNFYVKNTQAIPGVGGQLTEGVLGQPQYINPLLAFSETDQSLVKLIFSGLYKYGPNGELVPDLAESLPQISEDQKSYTINLKTNAHWHNQTPVSADDVVFTIQTLKNPDFKSPLRTLWLSTSVEKLSDYQVKFTTKDVAGPFAHNLTLPILPKKIWEDLDGPSFLLHKNNLEAIGNGPYAITAINRLPSGKIQSMQLQSFSKYHNGQARIQAFNLKFFDTQEEILNALRGREIEAGGIVPGLEESPESLHKNYNLVSVNIPQYHIAFFNLNHPLLAQQAVRDALRLATDRKNIIENIFQNQKAYPLDPLTKTLMPEIFNLKDAEKTLQQAGFEINPADGVRRKKNEALKFNIYTNDTPTGTKTAENLKEQWKKLGADVSVVTMPTKQLTEEIIKTRKYEVLVFSQKFGPDPDPFFFWHSSQIKDPGLNLTGLNDPALDKLLTESRNITDTELRQQKYAEISRLLDAKNTQILLNQNLYTYLADTKVKNIGMQSLHDTSHRYYDLPNWYIVTKREWK